MSYLNRALEISRGRIKVRRNQRNVSEKRIKRKKKKKTKERKKARERWNKREVAGEHRNSLLGLVEFSTRPEIWSAQLESNRLTMACWSRIRRLWKKKVFQKRPDFLETIWYVSLVTTRVRGPWTYVFIDRDQ